MGHVMKNHEIIIHLRVTLCHPCDVCLEIRLKESPIANNSRRVNFHSSLHFQMTRSSTHCAFVIVKLQLVNCDWIVDDISWSQFVECFWEDFITCVTQSALNFIRNCFARSRYFSLGFLTRHENFTTARKHRIMCFMTMNENSIVSYTLTES